MYATVEPDLVDTGYLDELTDAELVARIKLGQDRALDVLLRRHSESLYRFCCHLTGRREDAEDICQETIARAITRVDTLQTGSAFKSWLFSIARNLAMDSFRGQKRTCPLEDDSMEPIRLYEDSPHDRVEIGEERQTVAQALARLARSHQTVLMMREVQGMSYAEIARQLDVSQSAVETLLFRARRRLKEEYGKRAAIPALVAGLRHVWVRVASPFSTGGVIAAKVGIATLLVGTAVVTVPRVVHLPFADASRPAVRTASPAHRPHAVVPALTPPRSRTLHVQTHRRFAARAHVTRLRGVAGTRGRRFHHRSIPARTGLVVVPPPAVKGHTVRQNSHHRLVSGYSRVRATGMHGIAGGGSLFGALTVGSRGDPSSGRAGSSGARSAVTGPDAGPLSTVGAAASAAIEAAGGSTGGSQQALSTVSTGASSSRARGGSPTEGGSDGAGSQPQGGAGQGSTTVSNGTTQPTSGTSSSASQAGSGTASSVSQTVNGAANTVNQAAQQTGSTVGQATGSVNQATGQASNTVNQTTKQGDGTVNQATGQATSTAGGASNAVNQTVNGAAGTVGQTANGAGNTAGGTASQASGSGGGTKKDQGAAGQAGNQATNTVNQTTNSAAQTAGKAQGAANQATNQAQGAAGNAAKQGSSGNPIPQPTLPTPGSGIGKKP